MGAQASRLSGSLAGQVAAVVGAVTTIIVVAAGVRAIQNLGKPNDEGRKDSHRERTGKEPQEPVATPAPKTQLATSQKHNRLQPNAEVSISGDAGPQPQPPSSQLAEWAAAIGDAQTLSRRQISQLWVAIGGTPDDDMQWVAMCKEIGADAAGEVLVAGLCGWVRARNVDQSLDDVLYTLNTLQAMQSEQTTDLVPTPGALTPSPLSQPEPEPELEPQPEPVQLGSAREGAMKRLAEHDKEVLPGTRLFVEPFGEGTYVCRRKHTFGSNTHTVRFDDGSTHSVALGNNTSHWRVIAAPIIAAPEPKRMATFVHLFGVSTKRVGKDGRDSTVATFVCSGKHMTRSQQHSIDLYKCKIDDRRCCQIASMLPLCAPTLTRLNLDYGGIEDAGAVALSLVLPSCVMLRELSMSINAIGNTGGAALAEALPSCSCDLRTVALRSNELGDKAMDAFGKALLSLPGLATLDLRR